MSMTLIDSVNTILEKVKEISGKQVEFVEQNDLKTYAIIKMARKNMPSHKIFYKPQHTDVINHIIAHECGHIIRTFESPMEKRVIPMSDNASRAKVVSDLGKNIPGDIIDFLHQGIVRQITNMPPDIMIEKWLFNEYPEIWPYQKMSIEKQREEAIKSLSGAIRTAIPKKVYEANALMNYAFFRVLGMHFGVNYVQPFSNAIDLNKGKALAEMVTREYLDNFEGDVAMINRWAEFLGITGWFQWVDFENVPANYMEMF